MKETYKVLVTYGYLDDKTGISHIVHVSEPDASVDSTAVVASLAQQLDTYPDNKDFSWDVATCVLPEALVNRIRADAVRDYRAGLY